MASEKRFAIKGATIVTPESVERGRTLFVSEGRIESIGKEIPPGISTIDLSGKFLLPGFIDIHCHGSVLFSLTAGLFDPRSGSFDESDEAWLRGLPTYVRKLARDGLANVYIGTWAAPKEKLRRSFEHLKRYIESEANGREGPLVKGGFLEGTFLNPKMPGAQNPQYVLRPNRRDFDEINSSGCIKLANVVPDFAEPSFKLMDYLNENGVIIGAGHTDATAEQFLEGLRHGLRYVIHFTNGPTGGSYKAFHGGGVIEAVLQSDDVYAELILDTYHVNPAYVRDIIARKGIERIIGVTDQMFATGASGVKRFIAGGIEGCFSEDGRFVRVAGTKDTLFSSVLTMDVAFSNILSMLTREMPGVWNRLHPALSFEDALIASAKICSTNAARLLGLADESEEATGSVERGKWADLVGGSIEGEPGNYRFKVERLFVRGRLVDLTAPEAPSII